MQAVLIGAISAVVLLGCASGLKQAQPVSIETREVTYKSGEVSMVGYVAQPKGLAGKAPGVIVVHEWWGQNDYPRKRAEMLAEKGYVAMAIDMFGARKVADHPKTAGEFATAVMKGSKIVARRFNSALKVLREQPQVEADNIAAIGYCFGGSVVIEMAKQGADLKSVASFHGGLRTPTVPKTGKIKAEVAVFTGAKDPMIDAIQVSDFEKSLNAVKAKYSVVVYPNALHGFTNPQATNNGQKFGLPLAYDLEADQDSWGKLLGLLQKNFKR